MSATCDLSATGVVDQLLKCAAEGFDGWIAFRPNDVEVHSTWGFSGGRIVDLGCTSDGSFLESILLVSDELRDKDRKRVRKQAQASDRDPGEVVLELGLLSDHEVSNRLLDGVQTQLAEVLSFEHVKAEVQPGALARQPFGVARVLQLNLDTEEMVVGAARLLGAWSTISASLSSLKDVYYATPESFGYFQAAEDYPNEVALVSAIDGGNDLREVIQASGLDPFVAYATVQSLHGESAIALINPVQLFQQGCDLEKEHPERALRRFERAEERGLDDFDLGFKLAELYSQLGQDSRAIDCYMGFAEKCATQFRIEDTIRACSRIIEIDPDNLSIQDRYLSLLTKYAKPEETLSHGLALVRRFVDSGRDEQARSTLERLLEPAGDNEEIIRLYLEVCERTGHQEGTLQARRLLGDLFHDREETDKALELFQNLYVQGEQTAEVRSRLGELHLRRGNGDVAREHIEALRRLEGWSSRQPSPEALEFFRRLGELDNVVPVVTGWLVDEARNRGAREETTRWLELHCTRLEATENFADARRAAERLTQLSPLDISATRRLAKLEQQCGDGPQAARTLEKLAKQLADTDASLEEQREVLEALVKVEPLSIRARRLLLKLDPSHEPPPAFVLETTLLELLSGNSDAAVQSLETSSVGSPYLTFVAGKVCQAKSDQSAALVCFHRCAELAIARSDKCLLGDVLEELDALTPGDPALAKYRTKFEQFEVVNSPSRATEGVVQGSVQGITAKLKGLKTGESTEAPAELPTGPAAPPPAPTKKVGALSAVARLKAMKSDGGAVVNQCSESDTHVIAPPPLPTKPSGKSKLTGADKLKALRAAGSTPSPSSESAPPAESATPAKSANPAKNGIDPEPPVLTGDDATAVADIERPKPKTSKKLGGAASKLSALRGSSH